ncbi:MAG: nitrogen fixation protein NifH, partial [Bacillota bacterium]|nr:nitrogen fixation protein NifH [Bacillota bacterium]
MTTSSARDTDQEPDSVLTWLLEPSEPSVRYVALTGLMGKPADDPEVRSARAAIMREGLVPDLLSLQNEDGSWDDPERFYTAKYKGTVWTLLLLAELCADPAHPQVRHAGQFILKHSQHPESGGFSYTTSAKTGTGLASGVIPCLTGNMVYSLIRLGFLDDARVQQGIDWIVRLQRADDGDDQPPKDPAYARYEMCWGRHSCHMGVAKALKALTSIPPDRRSTAVTAKIDQLTEYFLVHHLYKKSHNLAEVAKPGWLKPGFPLMY